MGDWSRKTRRMLPPGPATRTPGLRSVGVASAEKVLGGLVV